MRRVAFAILACSVLLVAVGCGGSSKKTTSSSGVSSATTAASTQGDFASQVTSVCTVMLQKVKATIAQEQQIKNSSGTNAAKRAKVSPLLTEFKTELQALHDQLAPLQPPAGQETAFRQYLDSLAKGAIAAGQARTALDNNDQSAYTAADTQVSMEARKGNAAGAQVPALKVCVTG